VSILFFPFSFSFSLTYPYLVFAATTTAKTGHREHHDDAFNMSQSLLGMTTTASAMSSGFHPITDITELQNGHVFWKQHAGTKAGYSFCSLFLY
jgi:hypothetical protein